MIAVFLVPLGPAIALYRANWGGSQGGETSGTLFGVSFKLAGAAGVYVLFIAVAYQFRPSDTDHYHTWTVEGKIEAPPLPGEPDANLNDLFVRVVPPRLSVMNDGYFSWPVPVVEDSSGRLHFPNLQLDEPGFRGLTLTLDPNRSFGAAQVKMTHDESRRLIVFNEVIKLVSNKSGKPYAGIVPPPPPVQSPSTAATGDKP